MKWLSHVQLFATPWTVPTRLHPWDFPGKNAGVGCHFLLPGHLPDPGIEPGSPALQADALPSEPPVKPQYICMYVYSVSYSLQPCVLQPARLFCLWDSPGKNAGVYFHALLQGIFPTQGLNLCLQHHLHCRILYPLSFNAGDEGQKSWK